MVRSKSARTKLRKKSAAKRSRRGPATRTTEAALAAFAQRAERQRSEELLADFPVAMELSATWQPFALTVYRNWLSAISAQKQRLQRPAQYMAALRLDQAPTPAV